MSGDVGFRRRWVNDREVLPTDWTFDGRPLVVIDPEDREQVERLSEDLARHMGWFMGEPAKTARGDALQAALREFANPTPPKPDEPTGLGAVVEDADGQKWVRGSSMRGLKAWVNDDALDSEWSAYRDINAVRVLSEGVTA